jgi:hypothetical protein
MEVLDVTVESPTPAPQSTEQVEQSVMVKERGFDLDLDTLPALPQSRPESPAAEMLLAAADALSAAPQPSDSVEQCITFQDRGLHLDLENLPALPENRPDSPIEEAFALGTAGPTEASEVDTAEHTDVLPNLDTLPALPESRSGSPSVVFASGSN